MKERRAVIITGTESTVLRLVILQPLNAVTPAPRDRCVIRAITSFDTPHPSHTFRVLRATTTNAAAAAAALSITGLAFTTNTHCVKLFNATLRVPPPQYRRVCCVYSSSNIIHSYIYTLYVHTKQSARLPAHKSLLPPFTTFPATRARSYLSFSLCLLPAIDPDTFFKVAAVAVSFLPVRLFHRTTSSKLFRFFFFFFTPQANPRGPTPPPSPGHQAHYPPPPSSPTGYQQHHRVPPLHHQYPPGPPGPPSQQQQQQPQPPLQQQVIIVIIIMIMLKTCKHRVARRRREGLT